MNKLIKYIIESFFDDDIFTDDNEEDISKDIVSPSIKKLIDNNPLNLTKYPESFTDINRAKNYVNIANIASETFMKHFYPKDAINYECEFSDDPQEPDYIHFFIQSPQSNKTYYLFDFALKNNHIYYILNIYSTQTYYLVQSLSKKGNIQVAYLTAILPLLNICDIDEIRIVDDSFEEFTAVKNILIDGAYYKSHDVTDCKFNEENTKKLPMLTVPVGDLFINISKAYKNADILISYGNKFTSDTAFLQFLKYIKTQGFKKIKGRNFSVDGNSEPNETVFKPFMIKNKLEAFSFKDKHDIQDSVYNFALPYYENNKNMKRPSMYAISFEDKGKDEQGSYVKVLLDMDYIDNEDKYCYSKTYWKFYKSGLCELHRDAYNR